MQTKQAKRAKADASNTKWRSLTPQQQIEDLKKRPGESKKQISRLEAIIALQEAEKRAVKEKKEKKKGDKE